MTAAAGGTVLDWRHSRHWSRRPARCLLCGRFTSLRDEHGDPVHKVCAEAELDGRR